MPGYGIPKPDGQRRSRNATVPMVQLPAGGHRIGGGGKKLAGRLPHQPGSLATGKICSHPIANRVWVITSDAIPAASATTAPSIPIDGRNPSGKTVSVIRAIATVTALSVIVRPAVFSVVRSAPALLTTAFALDSVAIEAAYSDGVPAADRDRSGFRRVDSAEAGQAHARVLC